MKLKEVIEILQTFENKDVDVELYVDEFGDPVVKNVMYDTEYDIVIIRNYD